MSILTRRRTSRIPGRSTIRRSRKLLARTQAAGRDLQSWCSVLRGDHLALEDRANAALVGKIHDAERADRNIEVHPLDIGPELAATLAATCAKGGAVRRDNDAACRRGMGLR